MAISSSQSRSRGRPSQSAGHAGSGSAKRKFNGIPLGVLARMWEENLEFQKAIVANVGGLDEQEKVSLTKETLLHITTEINELLAATGKWKKVLQEDNPPSIAGIREELVDIFKFTLNIALFWGIEPLDFTEEFFRKTQVNWQKFKQATLPIEKSANIVILDLDGVLAKYPEHWLHFLKKNLPEELASGISVVPDDLNYLAPQVERKVYDDLKHTYRESGEKLKIPQYNGVESFTSNLRKMGFKIVILTRRPVNKYKRIYADTIFWLQNHGIQFDGIYWSEGEKAHEILRKFPNVQFVVEDDPEQVEDLISHKIRTFLIKRPHNLSFYWNSAYNDFMFPVGSFSDILDVVKGWKKKGN